MERIGDPSLIQSAPCSLIEFLLGDGISPGWLDDQILDPSLNSRSSRQANHKANKNFNERK
jgi:hypothetical protein